jgi:osmoprotectant transport system ATP-binding protein
LNKTIIFVTHDLFEALTLGDRIAIFHNGAMEQVGARQEILRRPATDFVRELFAKPAQQLQDFKDLANE